MNAAGLNEHSRLLHRSGNKLIIPRTERRLTDVFEDDSLITAVIMSRVISFDEKKGLNQ